MKHSQTLIFLCFLMFGIFSSKSQNTFTKNYICLDSISALSQVKEYELVVSNNWCTYIGFHDILSYSPNYLKNLSDNYYKNWLYVSSYDIESYKSADIEEALYEHVISYNFGNEYDRVYTSDYHEQYGKYYIVKYKSIMEGDKLLNLDIIFNYKNKDYIISYQVLEYQFDLYINEVIEILSSFKIKN